MVRFLMSLQNPSDRIIRSIESAVAWIDGPAKLKASEQTPEVLSHFPNEPKPEVIWSRLYEIGSNRPIFGDRDGKVYYAVTDISEERQRGYSWYGTYAHGLLERDYPRWRERMKKSPLEGD